MPPTNRSVLLTSRLRLRKPRGNVMLVLSTKGRPSSFSAFEPSRIVDSTAAAAGENVPYSGLRNQQWLTAISGATAMPQFDPELIEVMKKVLEDIMTRVPLEHSTPAAKAYFAECILKAAAQGQTNYDALIVAAASQIEVFVSLFS